MSILKTKSLLDLYGIHKCKRSCLHIALYIFHNFLTNVKHFSFKSIVWFFVEN